MGSSTRRETSTRSDWSKHNLKQQRQNSRREEERAERGPQEKRQSSGKQQRARRHQQEVRRRELYVVKEDVLKPRRTAACRACGNLVIGFPAGTVHSSESRQRQTS